LFNILCSCEV